MNWRIWRWWCAGICLYLICLLGTFPASYAVAWLQRRVPAVRLTGVSGSVWAGTAQEAAWQSQTWGFVRWRFDWSALFSGYFVGYHLHLHNPDITLQARVAANGGSLMLQDVTGNLPVSRLQPWLPLPPGSVNGQLNIKIQRMVLVNAQPTVATGTIKLISLSLTWPQPVTLGDYQLQLQTKTDGIHGNLLDTSGPLMVQGSLHLAPDGNYQLNGVLASRAPTDTALNNLLRYLPTNTDGQHTFSFNGRWRW